MERRERIRRIQAHIDGLEGLKKEQQTSTTLERFITLATSLLRETRELVKEEGVSPYEEISGDGDAA